MAVYKLINFGPLPHDLVNKILKTELEPGDVVLSAKAHRHIAVDHATDYPIIIPNMRRLITEPGYIGQSPRHNDSFEMVRRLQVAGNREIALVALSLEINSFGNYNIESAYRLKEEQVTDRLRSGHLKITTPVVTALAPVKK